MAGLGDGLPISERQRFKKGTCAQFLRQNPRFLNEPIRYLLPNENSNSVAECLKWTKTDEIQMSTQTSNKNNELDFMRNCTGEAQRGSQGPPSLVPAKRFTHKEPARGIGSYNGPASGSVPSAPLTVDDTVHTFKERISFQHGYDSRAHPNEPIRGKLHGSFVLIEKKSE